VRRIKSGATRQLPEQPRGSLKAPVLQSGAVQSRTGFSDVSKAWWAHHKTSAVTSLARLLKTPLQTLLTALVVAIALALPATLLMALNNIHQLGNAWDSSPKISVYLDVRARDLAIQTLRQEFEAMPEITQLDYIAPEQAARDFQRMSGFGAALEALEENPLPPTMVITPAPGAREPAQLQRLAERLAQDPLVDEVSLDMEWVRRLRELMVLGKRALYALASLLALGVLIALGNTIRLVIENRRDEIVVTKLVGGTDGFVRRPFLYTGGWYGFMGGLLACGLVAAGHWTLSGSVARLAATYQSNFELEGLGLWGNLGLLALSSLLGWLGAWLAVSRNLGQIQPR
jgi:cell division transport system permease protein